MIRYWPLDNRGAAPVGDGRLALLALEQIGRGGFADVLLDALQDFGSFDHCTIFRFVKDPLHRVSCHVVDAASRHRVPTAHRTSAVFAKQFAHFDVAAQHLDSITPGTRPLAIHLNSQDLPSADYRDACYLRNGLIERFSVVSADPCESTAVALNLYRSHRHGPMSKATRERLLNNGLLLAAAATRHTEMMCPKPVRGDEMLARIPGAFALSPREAQACALLLEGETVEATAAAMGIRTTTAITLKKRAFARVGVSSREELLRLAASHTPARTTK